MTMALTILVGIGLAVLFIGGLLGVSLWMSDRKAGIGTTAWKDNGSGNVDGYGSGSRDMYSDFGGGDAGGGGGD